MNKSDFPDGLVTRFAPSPTGNLHLGHVASAIYVWGIGRLLGAKINLRIEDHDRQRSKSSHEKSILEELSYLGFEPDAGVRINSCESKSDFRQSDHDNRYQNALKTISQSENTYHCICTRKDIIRSMEKTQYEELIYAGTCRDKEQPMSSESGVRIELTPDSELFTDLILGEQTQTPFFQCGDLLIKDKKGNWTYHFSNVVDDLEEKISLVIRGRDLLASTGRQIKLIKALGSEPPQYYHHPLIMEPDHSEKLSKRIHSESISDFMSRGESAASIIGRAAYAVGLTKKNRPIKVDEITELFE